MSGLRLGLVGCGFMGRLHAAAVAESPGAELRAVFDRDAGAAEAVAREHGAEARPSLDALIEDQLLDAIIVATPDDAHAEPVLKAARAGLDVFVEKPLAHLASEADEMIDTCERAERLLMVGHILRFETAYANLQVAVREGMVGPLVSVFARRHGLRSEAQRFRGEGHVIDYLGVHDFDLLNWLRPERPVAVTAVAARRSVQAAYGTPDLVMSTLEYGDGSVAVVESGWTLPAAWGPVRPPGVWSPFGDVRLDVFGERGALSVDMRTMNLTGVDEAGWRFPDTRHWPRLHGRIAGALRAEIDHFLARVSDRAEPVSTGRTAREAVVICEAARRSLDAGRRIALTDAPPAKEAELR